MTPDSPAAIKFLKHVHPTESWVLTAIRPDRKAIETRTFSAATEADALEWVQKYNGNRNIYWSVNPPIHAVSKKMEREDVKAVHYLHVDVDPRVGEEPAAAKARIVPQLAEASPPPTCIIDSGGGIQAFWKLATPIAINGDVGSCRGRQALQRSSLSRT